MFCFVVLVVSRWASPSEPDEAELLRVSRRLVEDAVNRALQQYKQETFQNGGGPNATAVQPTGSTEDTATKKDTKANSTTDNRSDIIKRSLSSWHHLPD
ncbi:A-kinase anchor protein 7 isoform gamma [Collichthys lucidus]|uniref:A-kinase anchor protein 7 isoform gamma n=1 Tax=Collichthys lucidus TaxID=240159 RepID=A0A4U5UMC2_COLLU|nr:A-kinase anchor protein 7 isoform gamma [Collichthys lucidus]